MTPTDMETTLDKIKTGLAEWEQLSNVGARRSANAKRLLEETRFRIKEANGSHRGQVKLVDSLLEQIRREAEADRREKRE